MLKSARQGCLQMLISFLIATVLVGTGIIGLTTLTPLPPGEHVDHGHGHDNNHAAHPPSH